MKTVVKGTTQRSVKVVEHRPFAGLIIVAFVVIALTAASYGSYFYGENTSRSNEKEAKDEIVRLTKALSVSQKQLRDAEQKLANIALGAEVDRSANETVRKEVTELREEIARLQEDNSFYRNLMAPTDDAKGLQIGTLELTRAGQDRRFSYRVVMQQLVSRHELLSGHLLFEIVGKQDGASKQYALKDLSSQVSAEKIKLRFKYFQNVEGELILPEGFEPDHIELIAQSSGKKPQRIEKKFGWLVEET